jgi:hypothetical protein
VTGDNENELPPELPVAGQLQARNNEYNLDLTGRVTNLDEEALLTTFPVEIPEGTVLYSIIDLRVMNATVRGLIRVRWQSEADELGQYRTLADFVDLNPDERRKILRALGKPLDGGAPIGDATGDGGAQGQSSGYIPMSTVPSRQPRAKRSNWLPKVSISGLIWTLLGLIFYSLVVLAVVAIFPQGRAWELSIWHRLWHEIIRTWPGLSHLFG